MTQVPDWLAALAIIVPAATALCGYWLAGKNEEQRDRRTVQREREARLTATRERLSDQRHEFQRMLLLELQDAMLREVRATTAIVLNDLGTLKKDGKVYVMAPGLSDEAYDAGVDFRRLFARVLDDDLRRSLEDVHRLSADAETSFVLLEESQDPAVTIARIEERRRAMTDRYIEVQELLGEHVRRELGHLPEDWSEPPELAL